MSGIGIDNTFQEIEIVRSPSGKPGISLGGWSEKISRKKNIAQLTVSMSHSDHYAIAAVIMTGA
jgi:holo-[acyl-carrier-protein] synthase